MKRDFIRHVEGKLQEVMQREIDLAAAVFDSLERTEIVLEIASSTQLAAILVALQTRKDGTDPYEVFDIAAGEIHARVIAQRALLPKALAEIERRGGRAAR